MELLKGTLVYHAKNFEGFGLTGGIRPLFCGLGHFDPDSGLDDFNMILMPWDLGLLLVSDFVWALRTVGHSTLIEGDTGRTAITS